MSFVQEPQSNDVIKEFFLSLNIMATDYMVDIFKQSYKKEIFNHNTGPLMKRYFSRHPGLIAVLVQFINAHVGTSWNVYDYFPNYIENVRAGKYEMYSVKQQNNNNNNNNDDINNNDNDQSHTPSILKKDLNESFIPNLNPRDPLKEINQNDIPNTNTTNNNDIDYGENIESMLEHIDKILHKDKAEEQKINMMEPQTFNKAEEAIDIETILKSEDTTTFNHSLPENKELCSKISCQYNKNLLMNIIKRQEIEKKQVIKKYKSLKRKYEYIENELYEYDEFVKYNFDFDGYSSWSQSRDGSKRRKI